MESTINAGAVKTAMSLELWALTTNRCCHHAERLSSEKIFKNYLN